MSENSELLQRYLRQKSEAAFSELVKRNIDLVYSAALRQVHGDDAAARDVTQAVFTDLARKAPTLAHHTSLAGWLYTSTRLLATKVLRAELRRRAREEKAYAMTAPLQEPDSSAHWEQLPPELDEVMHELSNADREAVLMRFFEGCGLGEIGIRLGVSENAARMRVDRALERLREALARRGITSSAAALAAVLTQRSVSAAPVGLSARVSKTAFDTGVSSGSLLGALLASLMAFKSQLIVGGALIVCLASAALLLHRNSNGPLGPGSPEPPAIPTTVIAAADSNTTAPAGEALTDRLTAGPAPSDSDSSNRVMLTLVASDSGKPVPNVQVRYWTWEGDKVRGRTPLQATRFGTCEVPFSRGTVTRLVLATESDGFADTRVQWFVDRGEKIPETFTVRMARAVRLGGVVVDADNQPVQGAQVGFNNDPGPAQEGVAPQTDNFGWPFWVTATTDAQGRWAMNRVSAEAVKTLYGGASHPEHVGSEFVWLNRDSKVKDQLLEGSHVFHLGRAAVVRGKVVDTAGEPVADANVMVGHTGESGRREGKTKSDGTFVLLGCKPGDNLLTAEAEGFAPTTLEVKVSFESDPFLVTLKSGTTLRLRVVNRSGQPLPGAMVWLNTFDHDRIGQSSAQPATAQVDFNRRTDAEGRVEWKGAPDQELSFDVSASGYLRVDRIKVRPDGREHIITLPPALTISGTVRDASSGQAIPKFRIITGWPQWQPPDNATNAHWSTIDRFWFNFSDGNFRHVFEEAAIGGTANPGFVFKFTAEGYAPYVSRVVGPEEEEVAFDVLLKSAASKLVTVLLPDGRPASGAQIALVSPGAGIELVPGGFAQRSQLLGDGILVADVDGRFKLSPDETVTGLVATHPEGFAEVGVGDWGSEPTLQLKPWGRLEGVLLSGEKGASGRELLFSYGPKQSRSISTDFQAYRTTTDENGRFVFAKVPAGKHRLVRLVEQKRGPGIAWMHQPLAEVDVIPGQTTEVTLGGNGYTVSLRLRWGPGLKREEGWQLNAWLRTPMPPVPEDARTNPQALAAWQALPEVKAALSGIRQFPLTENPDGSFSTEEVPPGVYMISVMVLDVAATSGSAKLRAHAETRVEVPSEPPSGTIDLGEIQLQPIP